MTSNEKDVVGYCHPPKHAQWKKGQSGNPGYKKPRKKLSRLIEEILREKIEIVEGGVKRRISVLEAILLQLWLKRSKGNRRAMRVLQKYEAFAMTKPEYRVVTEQDRKDMAAEYARHLKEGHKGPERKENMTAKEAAEMYHAALRRSAGHDGL